MTIIILNITWEENRWRYLCSYIQHDEMHWCLCVSRTHRRMFKCLSDIYSHRKNTKFGLFWICVPLWMFRLNFVISIVVIRNVSGIPEYVMLFILPDSVFEWRNRNPNGRYSHSSHFFENNDAERWKTKNKWVYMSLQQSSTSSFT